jgi:hypothetical protein
VTTSLSFDRKTKTRQLTAWLIGGACFAACATYDPPEKRADEGPDHETAGGAGKDSGGADSVAGVGGTGSAAGSGPTPSGGTPGASGGGGAGGSSTAGASVGGAAAEGGESGEGGAAGSNACPDCAALQAALLHRYDFEGSGTAVMDRAGTAHGAVVGGGALSTVEARGVLVLAGGTTGAYVNLPNGLVSSLTNATFEAWVTWAGGAAWQRIFDFGDSTDASPEDNPENGKSYLFLTAETSTGGVMRAAYSLNGIAAETHADAAVSLPLSLTQVVVVVDAAGGQLLQYQDGKVVGGQALSGSLGSLNDVNCWLGRSQYDADPEFGGTFHDFRIYDAALTPSQIAASFAGGPDPAFLAE